MTMETRLKIKYKLHRYDINTPRPRHRHKYTKYKMYLSMIMAICIKQHLSNIGSSIHKGLSNCEVELKKSVAF